MTKIKLILARIGIILIGITCWQVVYITHLYELGYLGVICPFVGLIMVLYGLFSDEKKG